MSLADANAEYWVEYSNLQHVKHELIRHYLNGWFPKMTLGATGCKRLLYIDTHAGRGRHLQGQLGSPLVALTTLSDHQARDRILKSAEVRFHFIERDEQNLAALNLELNAPSLPANVVVTPESGDCFQIIERGIASVENVGQAFPPSFIFVDPYGFKLPGQLLRKLMSYPKVELFVNVIWRELDMAIQQVRGNKAPQPTKIPRNQASLFDDDPEFLPVPSAQRRPANPQNLIPTLNTVFDGDAWRGIDAPDADGRAEQCADLFRTITKARWGTHIRMLDNGRVRYFLLHLTNHDDGRDLMKDCIWKACPAGGFSASKADSPRHQFLIQPEPDLTPLCAWVREKLTSGAKRWHELGYLLREELWRDTHLNQALREMRTAGEIQATGKFFPKHNPLLSLTAKRG